MRSPGFPLILPHSIIVVPSLAFLRNTGSYKFLMCPTLQQKTCIYLVVKMMWIQWALTWRRFTFSPVRIIQKAKGISNSVRCLHFTCMPTDEITYVGAAHWKLCFSYTTALRPCSSQISSSIFRMAKTKEREREMREQIQLLLNYEI